MMVRRGASLLMAFAMAWSLSAAAVSEEDPSPPTLSNFSATPSTLPYQGGPVELRIDAVDPDGIDSVGATVYLADGGAFGLELTVADPSQPDTYSGSASIPANFTNDSVSHGIEVLASDTVGDQTLEIVGNIDVEGQPQFDEPPDVFDPEVTPTILPSEGGEVSISASATDDRAISEVYAVLTTEAGSEVVGLDGLASGRYGAIWTAPPNTGESDLTYTRRDLRPRRHRPAGHRVRRRRHRGGQPAVRRGTRCVRSRDRPPLSAQRWRPGQHLGVGHRRCRRLGGLRHHHQQRRHRGRAPPARGR